MVSRGARLLFVVACLSCSSGCASTPSLRSVAPLVSPPRPGAPLVSPINTIVLDAGHGGHDPGASHFGLKEKHLTLEIVKQLRSRLREAGLTVVMTRESDRFIPLSGRPNLANRLPADLFVSVHVNANSSRHVSGVEVYYPRVSEVPPTAPWPPSVSLTEVGIPSTTVKQVLWDLVLGRTRAHSRRLAASICQSMRRELRVACRGTRPARFVVLREAWMPAVLVEVGYMTNRAEAARLGMPAYRQAIAHAIADGIASYLGALDRQHL